MKTLSQQSQKELITPENHTTTFEEFDELYKELYDRVWEVKGKNYHLPTLGWDRRYNERESFGLCSYRYSKKAKNHYKLTKRVAIWISKSVLTANLDRARLFEDVVRHEIAHAIDCEIRGHSNHDRHWKSICVEVGAEPERLYAGQLYSDKTYKYTLSCDSCGNVFHKSRMGKNREYSCARCAPTKFDRDYLLNVEQNY